jgi:hypothetical protein
MLAAKAAQSAAEGEPFQPGALLRLSEAQLQAQQAIYHELRHGHDQQADQTAAMKNLIDAIEKLAHSLPGR